MTPKYELADRISAILAATGIHLTYTVNGRTVTYMMESRAEALQARDLLRGHGYSRAAVKLIGGKSCLVVH